MDIRLFISRKGTIPHEMITRFDSLDIVPEKEFFSIEQFYSRLKGDIISQQEYESVKKIILNNENGKFRRIK